LLTGKMSKQTVFARNDHRNYNRQGEAFDVGETFAGVDFESGLRAVEKVRSILPEGMNMVQLALRWILMFDAVTLTIPGAKNRQQALENANASGLPHLSGEMMASLMQIYDMDIRKQVHQRW
jgi:aryl-alcohol dehydrogenase-like predicted oxidoreductase